MPLISSRRNGIMCCPYAEVIISIHPPVTPADSQSLKFLSCHSAAEISVPAWCQLTGRL